jgi:hypothetical protein
MGEIDHRDFIYPGDDVIIAAEKDLRYVIDNLDFSGESLAKVRFAIEDIENYDSYTAAKVAVEDFKEELEEIRRASIVEKWDDGEIAAAVVRFQVMLNKEGV